jgi:hypothetical protein
VRRLTVFVDGRAFGQGHEGGEQAVHPHTFNLIFWRAAGEAGFSNRLEVCVRQLLRDMDDGKLAYVASNVHGMPCPLLGRYALEQDPGRRLLIKAQIEVSIESALTRDEASGIAFDLPYVDKAEFAAIMTILSPERRELITSMFLAANV